MKSRAGQKFYRSETQIPSAMQQEMLLPELQEHKELVTDQFSPDPDLNLITSFTNTTAPRGGGEANEEARKGFRLRY